MTSKQAVADAIRTWCEQHDERKRPVLRRPSHVYPLAYVIGYAAPHCLVVAVPWTGSESQCRDFDRGYPLKTIHHFSEQLCPGDWCSVAYVCREGSQELMAIPVVTAAGKKRRGA